jgi:hypothetical protein
MKPDCPDTTLPGNRSRTVQPAIAVALLVMIGGIVWIASIGVVFAMANGSMRNRRMINGAVL